MEYRYTQEIKAFHEAGHAVVATLLGVEVTEVNLISVPHKRAAGTYMHLTIPDQSLRTRAAIVIALAGEMSEGLFIKNPESFDRRTGDNAQAVGFAKRCCNGDRERTLAYIWDCQIQARTLLLEHRAAVRTIATKLCKKRRLSGYHVRAIVNGDEASKEP